MMTTIQPKLGSPRSWIGWAAALFVLLSLSLVPMGTVKAESYEDALKRVGQDLKSRNPEKRLPAVEALAETGDKRAVSTVFDLVQKEWHHFSAMDMGRSLRHFQSNDALELIEKKLRTLKGQDSAFHILYLYTGIAEGKTPAGDSMIGEALHGLKNSRVYTKTAVLEAIALAKRDDLADKVAEVLKIQEKSWNEDWQIVPITAATTCVSIASETNKFTLVEGLAAALEYYKDPKIRHFAANAAASISGEKAYTDYRFWRYWVKTKGAMEEAAKPRSTDGNRPKPKFFGTEAVGNRIVFVIDRSGSMGQPVTVNIPKPPKEEPKKEEEENVTGKRDKGKEEKEEEKQKEVPPPDYSKVKIKLDLAKVELIYTLRQLTDEYEFNVVVYSQEHDFLIPNKKGWIKATDKNKEPFIDAVNALTHGGSTNIHGSLTRALKVTKKGSLKKEEDPALNAEVFRSGAETVFFLTDGVATHSDFSLKNASRRSRRNAGPSNVKDPYGRGMSENIARDIARINTFRKCVINTVGIGPHDNFLLKTLADRSGGVYKDMTGLGG